jgi:hypothetical protein
MPEMCSGGVEVRPPIGQLPLALLALRRLDDLAHRRTSRPLRPRPLLGRRRLGGPDGRKVGLSDREVPHGGGIGVELRNEAAHDLVTVAGDLLAELVRRQLRRVEVVGDVRRLECLAEQLLEEHIRARLAGGDLGRGGHEGPPGSTDPS